MSFNSMQVIALIYLECPHCHAIFSLPEGSGGIPERVRCGECSTVFIPEHDEKAEQAAPEAIESRAPGPLSINDFLTDESSNRDETEATDDDVREAWGVAKDELETDDKLNVLQKHLNGDQYPDEPPEVLPDLNQMSAIIPETDDPLKQRQQSQSSEEISDQIGDSLDDETADLISDRLDGDEEEQAIEDSEESGQEAMTASEQDGLPEIQEDLILKPEKEPEVAVNTSSVNSSDDNPAYDKFRVYLESVNMAEDERADDEQTLTGEISAFIDEIDDGADGLFSEDQTETDIDRKFLGLDDEADDDEDFSDDGVGQIENTAEQTDLVTQLEKEHEIEAIANSPRQSSLLPEDDVRKLSDNAEIVEEVSEPTAAPFMVINDDEELASSMVVENHHRPVWPFVTGGILLILLLAIQYIHANRAQFAEYPETRGFITGLCHITGCEIAAQRDIDSIQLLNHAVYSHPTKESALIIKLLIRNKAKFTQPYPIIELSMADLNDHKLALRRFGPGEYLTEIPEEKSLMPVNVNIPVQVQVLDPDQNAVAFEFEFY